MPFYEELSHFLSIDRAITILHTHGTTTGGEDSPAGIPLQEEVQKGPRTSKSLGSMGHKIWWQW